MTTNPMEPEKVAPVVNATPADMETADLKVLPDGVHTDIALELYQESLAMDPERRKIIANQVKRKIDFILLPIMCFIYFLSFLDKQTLNYANAYGLQKGLGLHGRNYSWIASVTNIGYLVCAYPSTAAMHKLPVGKYVSVNLMIWGSLLMLTCAAKNFAGMMALRFLLGGAEACIGPAWMMLTSMFWTREEAPFRMSWWLGCNGLSSLVGAGISWGLGHTNNPNLPPWKLVFLVVGIISFFFGILSFFCLPDTPNNFRFFNREEKVVAIWRVASNRIGVRHEKILWYQVIEAAKDIKVYCIALQALCIGIINGSVANFLSALLLGFGYSSIKTVLYQMPTGAMQFILTVSGGLFVSKTKNTLALTIILAYIPGICGMIGIATIDMKHQLALAACTWLQGACGLGVILTWTLVASNIAGHTKRTMVNGVEFAFYAAGNIIGPFLFDPAESPRYITAIKTLAGMFGGAMFFTATIWFIMFTENRKRSKFEVDQAEANIEGFTDRTDKENKGFIYKL